MNSKTVGLIPHILWMLLSRRTIHRRDLDIFLVARMRDTVARRLTSFP